MPSMSAQLTQLWIVASMLVTNVQASRSHDFDLAADLDPSDDHDCSQASVGCSFCGMKNGYKRAVTYNEGAGVDEAPFWTAHKRAKSADGVQGVLECWKCDHKAGYRTKPDASGKCVLCTAGCSRCAKSGDCEACKDNYLWPNGTCAPCKEKKYAGRMGVIRKDGKCLPCADKCSNCRKSGPGKCDESMCIPGFGNTPDGRCEPCSANCEDCSKANTCESPESCKEGWGFNDKQECMPCADNCRECPQAGAGKCDRCLDGFTEKDLMCSAGVLGQSIRLLCVSMIAVIWML